MKSSEQSVRVAAAPRTRAAEPRGGAFADLVDALQAALTAADPRTIVSQALKLEGGILRAGDLRLDLSRFGRVMVIGGGKASGKMAEEVERILGERITSGLVNIPEYQKPRPDCERIKLHGASHPVPSAEGVRGVRSMLDLVGRPKSDDLVICLISGGGSSLLSLPLAGLTLRDLGSTTDLLLKSGAAIAETNSVRKRISAIGGGRLAERLYPATVLSLIISDVVGDELDAIASGPTVPDSTTAGEAEGILKKYGIWERAPAKVCEAIRSGAVGGPNETPKEGSKVFASVHNLLVGSNRTSCLAAAEELKKKGYSTVVLSTRISGDASDVGRLFGNILVDAVKNQLPFAPPACVIAGGETTVTVRGSGKGGRNQELALSAALVIDGLPHTYVASMGTDGVDGPTTAAGAVADGGLVARARSHRLDPEDFLRRNDSNTFFKNAGGLILTGPTGTNVNDIMIAMASAGS